MWVMLCIVFLVIIEFILSEKNGVKIKQGQAIYKSETNIINWGEKTKRDLSEKINTNPASGLPMTGGIDIQGNPLGHSDINPASGLPMTGGIDIQGNPLGHSDINPASGLPMTGGIDIQGNPFGTNN